MKFTGKNLQIDSSVKIGSNVRIGDNVTIYPNVVIGDNTIICNDCVIGEPTMDYYSNLNYVNKPTIIGSNCLIRSHCIFYAGSVFGDFFQTGHQVTIRENSIFGCNCSVGTKSDIQGTCKIGDYTRMHSYVNIGQYSEIGSYVIIYPFVVLTNDPLPPSDELIGVFIDDYSIISSHSVLIGGVSIGKHCLIGANSTVNKSVTNNSLVVPSFSVKILNNLFKLPFFTKDKKRKYPWPYNFSRGMPWAEKGYQSWLEENNSLDS